MFDHLENTLQKRYKKLWRADDDDFHEIFSSKCIDVYLVIMLDLYKTVFSSIAREITIFSKNKGSLLLLS